MAAVENLEIIVDVDISGAIASLEELKQELRDVASSINRVDARGAEGIDVETNVEPIADDIAAMRTQMAAMDDSELFTNADLGSLRGVIRDAIGDAVSSGISDASQDAQRAAMGVDGDGFNRPFMAMGSRANARTGRIRAGFDWMEESNKRGSGLVAMLGRLRGQFSETLDGVNISMSDFHNLLARLLPLIGVFVGAMPAAIVGIYGLAAAAAVAAGALASLTALGALGVALEGGELEMSNLRDVMSRIRDDFIDAFAPLAEQLQPLFMEGVRGLERLFDAIAAEGDVLLGLRDDARAFGGFVLDFVPDALATLGAFVESMGPLFASIGRAIDENFGSVVMTVARITQEAVPALAQMALIIGRALPAIIRMSTGFAAMVSILLKVAGMFGSILQVVGIMPEHFGFLIATVLTLVSVFALLNSQAIALVAQGFARLGQMIITRVIPTLGAYIQSALAAGGATRTLALSLTSLVGILGVLGGIAVLSGLVGGLGSQFGGLKSNVDAATKSLEEFKSVQDGLGAGMDGRNPYREATPSQFTGSGGRGVSAGETVVIEDKGGGDADSNARTDAWRRGRFTSSER